MSAEDNRRAFAALAARNPNLLPEGSVIVVTNGRAALVTEDDGTPTHIRDLLGGRRRKA